MESDKVQFSGKNKRFQSRVLAVCISTCTYYGHVFFHRSDEESDFETIPVAIVTQSTGEEDVFQEYLETMGDDKEALINVRPMAEEEAVTALGKRRY